MAQVLLTAVLVLGLLEPAISSSHGSGPHWGYVSLHDTLGPSEWYRGYEHCGGHSQSPINIISGDAQYNPSLTEFDLSKYNMAPRSMKLKNVGGHTVEVEFPEHPEITISGGNLNGEYRLAQFHFHWGRKDYRGSEHQVDNKPAPMEMHLVHKRPADYSNWKPELAVLSFLFEVGDYNAEFKHILQYFGYVQYSGQEREIHSFPVAHLLPNNAGLGGYYRYNGSLTTPPCSETVVWTVFKDKIEISASQLKEFRRLKSMAPTGDDDDDDDMPSIMDNFRPVQALNGRYVETNKGNTGYRYHNVHKRSPHSSSSSSAQHSHSHGQGHPAPFGGHGQGHSQGGHETAPSGGGHHTNPSSHHGHGGHAASGGHSSSGHSSDD